MCSLTKPTNGMSDVIKFMAYPLKVCPFCHSAPHRPPILGKYIHFSLVIPDANGFRFWISSLGGASAADVTRGVRFITWQGHPCSFLYVFP